MHDQLIKTPKNGSLCKVNRKRIIPASLSTKHRPANQFIYDCNVPTGSYPGRK